MSIYNFREVVGNRGSVSLLQRSLVNDKFRKFTILEGYHGVGKSTTALLAAMTLTCVHPVDGNPCQECTSCKAIISSLSKTGKTSNFYKVNIPDVYKERDFDELLKEIFSLQSGSSRIVYVLEEAHAIRDENNQNKLLERIDRMPANVFVIMTTTEVEKLSKPLRSRALVYHFGRLNKKESKILLDILCTSRGIKIPYETQELILQQTHGIARDIESSIDFISDNEVTTEEYLSFLFKLDINELIQLFVATESTNVYDSLELLDNMLDNVGSDKFISQLKSFILEVLFLTEGDFSEKFSTDQKIAVKNIMGDKPISKIISVIEKLNKYSTEEDIKLSFVKIRQLLKGSSEYDFLRQNKNLAKQQFKEAGQRHAITNTIIQDNKNKESNSDLDIMKFAQVIDEKNKQTPKIITELKESNTFRG